MGVVYEAEQIEPVRRRVALKLLRPGFGNAADFLARFDAERQALAVMDHPSIARVFDAGNAPDGSPYYVMERVIGVPITQFCDDLRLTTRERLELFVEVCNAVQHAHQKGVIHRDLKPSNVLVTMQDDRPVPKIIDFGIAKALGGRLTELTLVTLAGRVLGTPAYMSPEQWDPTQFDVDTRTDIYSLGVMLYEILVGRLPFDPTALVRAGPAAALMLRQTVPDAPSVKYRSLGLETDPVAAARRTDPRGLARLLRGDLDWITLKAIEPDRGRRYETAHSLAGDIGRYLRSEPILARPPNAWYRFTRFVHRHRFAAGAAAAVLVGTVAVTAVTVVQARRVARERDRATEEAAKSQALNSFLENTLLSPDPITGIGRNVTVVEALDSAVARLATEPITSRPVEGSIKNAIGWAYHRLGLYDKAEPLLLGALAIRRSEPGPDSTDLGQSLLRAGVLYQTRAKPDSARALFKEALAIRRNLPPGSEAELGLTLTQVSYFLGQQGDTAEARAGLAEAYGIYRRIADSAGIAMVENYQGILAHSRGDLAAAERHFATSVAIRRAAKDPALGDALGNLGVVYDDRGRLDEAERAYRESIAELEARFGPEHDMVTGMLNNLANLLDRQGKAAEAESTYRRVIAIDRRKLGRDHPNVAISLANLSMLLCQRGRPAAGSPMADTAMGVARRHFHQDSWQLWATQNAVGICHAAAGRYQEAEATLLTVLRAYQRLLGPSHWRIDSTRARLSRVYRAWGKPDRAAELDSAAPRTPDPVKPT
jgi:non-specific serine/threonine protein kinase/serine/threonine-protein kinase